MKLIIFVKSNAKLCKISAFIDHVKVTHSDVVADVDIDWSNKPPKV